MTENWISDFQPFATGIFALLGTLAGGLITFKTQRHIAELASKREARETALAFAAEIEAYLDIVDERGHTRSANVVIAALEAGENVSLDGFGVDRDEEIDGAFPIFRSMHSRIGSLGPNASGLATFYMRASAVRSSARAGARGEYEHFTRKQKADFIRQEMDVWQETVVYGRRLVTLLRKGTE